MSPLPDRMVVDRIRGAPDRPVAERTTAAAPSVNEEHINRVSGHTMGADWSTSSMVTSDWNWALGLRAPCRRALAATAANCSTVAPRSSMRSVAQAALRAISTEPDGFSRSACIWIRSARGTPSSMPARVSPRFAGPHLFDPDGQHRPGAPEGGQRGQVQSRRTSRARVVDVDDAGVAQAGLLQERLAPDAPLVEQAPGGGIAEHHQIDLGRIDRRAGQGVGHDLVGHVDRRAVLPVHGSDAGAHDVCALVHGDPLILGALDPVSRKPAGRQPGARTVRSGGLR